ncbi:MAG: ABC transporter ATP-binding protein [Acidobacteriota bacterium]
MPKAHTRPPDADDTAAAALSGVRKRYGDVQALRGINLAVRRGEVLALLGPNGAGKTTAISLLLGLLRPDAGSVHVLGGDPRSMAVRRRLGAMLQASGVAPTLTVREQIDLFRSYYPRPAPVRELIEVAGLGEIQDRRVGRLSGGQNQRVLFALALAGHPELVFLDEPTAGMDARSRRRLWESVRGLSAAGTTVLLTTHHLEEASALADRVALIDRGRLTALASPKELEARVSGRMVRCVTRLELEAVAAMPEVHSVERRGAAIEILTPRAENLLRRMLDLDPSLSELEVGGAGLEQAFLALTAAEGDDENAGRERAA